MFRGNVSFDLGRAPWVWGSASCGVQSCIVTWSSAHTPPLPPPGPVDCLVASDGDGWEEKDQAPGQRPSQAAAGIASSNSPWAEASHTVKASAKGGTEPPPHRAPLKFQQQQVWIKGQESGPGLYFSNFLQLCHFWNLIY